MPPIPAAGPLQLTLGIIKPSVCSSQAQVKEVLQTIKQSGLEVRASEPAPSRAPAEASTNRVVLFATRLSDRNRRIELSSSTTKLKDHPHLTSSFSLLQIVRQKRMFWKTQDAEKFYSEHAGRFYFPRLVQHATSSPLLTLALYGPSSIQTWRQLIGPTHVYKGQWTSVQDGQSEGESGLGLRAKYGISDTRNGFHGSDSEASARKELEQVFEGWDIGWWLRHKEEEMRKAKSS
ncbi:BZ3500_MvSof-1268-A1-R1_Chr11-3g03582 [Microbotryum saponariae]|uniref:Nucleoside diphosphate kinase n=1 Tax=Microbotryum saponariae TaxID=289078 RepID=A0A2X0L9Q0_9BASI|nr:BZ3500_MvSof-1268-A1-R1_Chr11-3g03582 [Microbotryum saponariae]SDA03591.1 BZ3501_MvSof-1269-A2-R1_Chr11g03159 [Microbotryum saponariae]